MTHTVQKVAYLISGYLRIIQITLALAASMSLSGVEIRAESPLTTVILVRHAERPPGANPSLSPEGLERALRLGEMLRKTELSAIFATQFCRTVQTAEPIALRQNRAIEIYPTGSQNVDFSSCQPAVKGVGEIHPFQTSHISGLANAILREHSGETVLVSGHSDTVPALISELGGPNLCPDPFPVVDGECHISTDEHDNLFILTISRKNSKLLRLRF